MNVVANTFSRLRVGDVFKMEGRLFRVDLVNDCRARCAPITRTTRTFTPQTGPRAGEPVEFKGSVDYANISPNSEVEIIGYWKSDTQSVRFYGAEASESPVAESSDASSETPAAIPDLGEQQTLL